MYLPAISKSIGDLLTEFKVKQLPNFPNIYGVYEQSQIIYEITEGDDTGNNLVESDEVINLTLKISIACEQRTNRSEEFNNVEYDLETLISVLIKTFRKQFIPRCKRIEFKSFQKFAPDSGKYRAMLTFNIPAYITELPDTENDITPGKIERINLNYRE